MPSEIMEKVLEAERLCDEYKKLNALYFGEDIVPDDEIAYEWERIPHFYYNFYVYKYATGFSAAAALSRKILAGEIEPYMRFLKAGGSRDVLDIMKDAGVDFLNGDPVGEALALFKDTVERLEKSLI